tara:strand:- start:382 stop:1731 length:1350 start_codon:yes stop_codon:yes gene_type:complete
VIHIEKIANTLKADDSHHHKWGHPQLYGGLIDNFYPTNEKTLYHFISKYNAEILGKKLIDKCSQNGIALGVEFGAKGIEIKDLINLDTNYDEYWWEVNFITLMQLSKNHLKKLLQRFKFIVHDYVEGGTFLTVGNIDPYDILTSIEPNCNIKIAHSGYNYNKKNDIHIPMYALHSYCHAKKYLPDRDTVRYNPQHLGLCFINKPKELRLILLSQLDEKGLLSNMEWSCNINYNKNTKTWFGEPLSDSDVDKILNKNKNDQYEFYSGATLSMNDPHYMDVENFKDRYMGIFPKSITGLDFTKDYSIADSFKINPDLIGKFKYNIVFETLGCDHGRDFLYSEGFVSDKIFKSMLYCAPILSIADPESQRYLNDIGFEILEVHGRIVEIAQKLDTLTHREQIDYIIEVLQNPDKEIRTVYKYIAEENYNLITNEDFLCSLVVKPLKTALTRQ